MAQDLITRFPRALREAGLAIDPTRSINFLNAVMRAPLHGLADLARIGRVTLTSSPDEFPIFDSVFEAWFARDAAVLVIPEDEGDEEVPEQAPKSDPSIIPEILPGDTSGKDASRDEDFGNKSFSEIDATETSILKAISKLALPSVVTRRWRSSVKGSRVDLARTATEARRTFGETLRLQHKSRPYQARKILLLIDISGSMKVFSETYLRVAHALVQTGRPIEVFCFGTRLTRVTKTLRHRNSDEALAILASMVFDFDGGTRIGESLIEFLTTSRHASLVRGAVTVILSDGLERGDIAPIQTSIARLSRLSRLLVWLTPLAQDTRYQPVTRALSAIMPDIDHLGEASDYVSLLRSFSKLLQIEKQTRGQALRFWSKERSAA